MRKWMNEYSSIFQSSMERMLDWEFEGSGKGCTIILPYGFEQFTQLFFVWVINSVLPAGKDEVKHKWREFSWYYSWREMNMKWMWIIDCSALLIFLMGKAVISCRWFPLLQRKEFQLSKCNPFQFSWKKPSP